MEISLKNSSIFREKKIATYSDSIKERRAIFVMYFIILLENTRQYISY